MAFLTRHQASAPAHYDFHHYQHHVFGIFPSGLLPSGLLEAHGRLHTTLRATAPECLLGLLALLAGVLAMATFAAVPQLFWCPRWAVRVEVLPPIPVQHEDPAAPFDLSDLVVVTGATLGFFDRMSNMVRRTGSQPASQPEGGGVGAPGVLVS